MVVALVLLAVVAAVAIGFAVASRKPKVSKKGKSMDVLYSHPADSPGYVRLIMLEPVGHKQASAKVVARGPAKHPNGEDVEHEIHLHGQREFDVAAGSIVVFPDGTQFQTAEQ